MCACVIGAIVLANLAPDPVEHGLVPTLERDRSGSESAELIPWAVPMETTLDLTYSLPFVGSSEDVPSCHKAQPYGNPQWFTFAPMSSCTVTFDTCTAGTPTPIIPDTVLTLYAADPNDPSDTLVELMCEDDVCPGEMGCCLDSIYGADYSGFGSELSATLEGGQVYYLQVGVIGWFVADDYQFAMGGYVLTIDVEDAGPTWCGGDVNCDGVVDFDDIDPFVAALGCPSGDPNCWDPQCPWLNADCNDDDTVDFDDIDPFVGRIGATCS